MSAIPNRQWTAEEYLAYERQSDEKHELIDGEICAMSGASREHNTIVFNLARVLGNQLVNFPCQGYSNDMRVKVGARQYFYPDLAVVCDESEFEDSDVDTLLNPTLIIEVLSPSTESYDRGRKFLLYRSLPSLQEYVLISQEMAYVEHFVREQNHRWTFSDVQGSEAVLELPSIHCTLSLNDVYNKVTFDIDVLK